MRYKRENLDPTREPSRQLSKEALDMSMSTNKAIKLPVDNIVTDQKEEGYTLAFDTLNSQKPNTARAYDNKRVAWDNYVPKDQRENS